MTFRKIEFNQNANDILNWLWLCPLVDRKDDSLASHHDTAGRDDPLSLFPDHVIVAQSSNFTFQHNFRPLAW